jgi:hypothetical protein
MSPLGQQETKCIYQAMSAFRPDSRPIFSKSGRHSFNVGFIRMCGLVVVCPRGLQRASCRRFFSSPLERPACGGAVAGRRLQRAHLRQMDQSSCPLRISTSQLITALTWRGTSRPCAAKAIIMTPAFYRMACVGSLAFGLQSVRPAIESIRLDMDPAFFHVCPKT